MVFPERSINSVFIGGSEGNPNPEVTEVAASRGKQEELKCGLARHACEANSLQSGSGIARDPRLDRSRPPDPAFTSGDGSRWRFKPGPTAHGSVLIYLAPGNPAVPEALPSLGVGAGPAGGLGPVQPERATRFSPPPSLSQEPRRLWTSSAPSSAARTLPEVLLTVGTFPSWKPLRH